MLLTLSQMCSMYNYMIAVRPTAFVFRWHSAIPFLSAWIPRLSAQFVRNVEYEDETLIRNIEFLLKQLTHIIYL